MKYIWIGPEGWQVQGIEYASGEELHPNVPKDQIEFFLKLGFIESVSNGEELWQS